MGLVSYVISGKIIIQPIAPAGLDIRLMLAEVLSIG
jgi:hypothetical protein